ncbi:MAG TPA: hypothetical protein VFT32_12250 [Candidatus Eisenbacteria bacterium]|nr:hypothetical protein [Candidatus Eisenbacteria bacterium]
MAVAAKNLKEKQPSPSRQVEIRVRFEPGLGMKLYAAIQAGEVGPVTVARTLGRGRALLRYHGFTLMAQGAPDWKDGETFPVVVKEVGPPLLLATVGSGAPGTPGSGRVTTIDSAVVPGTNR